MNKRTVHQLIIQTLQNELEVATLAAQQAHESATDKENVAENKYDTLGLEASYLAHGQAKRVHELQQTVLHYETLCLKAYTADTPIDLTALVTIEDNNKQQQTLFIGLKAGGVKVQCQGKEVSIISPSAPLGKLLMEKYEGDDIQLHLGNRIIEYEIVSVF